MDLFAKLTGLYAIPLIVCTAIIAIAAYGLYNVLLHPLRKYPGPILWRAYRFPYVLNNNQGRLPFRVHEFHRTYGPVVRIAPNELAFTDAAAWDDIQGLLANRRQNPKDFHAYGPQEEGYEKNIIYASDTDHGRIRRIYGPAFTAKAVEEQSGMLLKYSNLLVSSLNKALKANPVQDMSAWYNFTTFDLTGEFAFDSNFQCLEQGGKYHFFMNTVLGGVIAGNQVAQLDRYGIWTFMRPLIPKSMFKARDDMNSYTAALVDRRIEKGHVPGKVDVFNYLLQGKKEEDQLSRDELVENGIVLVVAGSETTATLLTGATWRLCQNPLKLQKVVKEVRSAFKTDDEITTKSVNDLPYMIAVLSEAMRTFPPTPFGFSRIIGSESGQQIAGHFVPHGTRCAVFHWAAYHSERNFHKPNDFVPERWLADAPAEYANDVRGVLQPFHAGPRACLGKNLAYAEMRILLAKMLWHFDFELANPEDDWIHRLRGFTVWERQSLMIRLKPVKR